MSGKQMEGDNRRRRTLARRAREQGRQPSEAGATLGSSQQVEHESGRRRAGPATAGANKPTPHRGGPPSPPPPPTAGAPGMGPAVAELQVGEGFTPVRYRELVADVGRRAGVDFDQARLAAEATVIALARALDDADRRRLLDAVPPALHDDYPVRTPRPPRSLANFLDEVARMTLRSREQARYQAQATLNALAEQDGELIDSLDIPSDIRDLLAPQPTGGGLVHRTGRTPPLSDGEVRAALARLPYWSGSRRALVRALVLPQDNLDRVVSRLELLREQTGRGPHITRRSRNAVVVVLRTHSVDAVTALDVELARAVDAAVEEVGAGIAS